MDVFWIILVIYSIACALFTSTVARTKHYDGFNWGVGGFFLGIIALIAICGMPVGPDDIIKEMQIPSDPENPKTEEKLTEQEKMFRDSYRTKPKHTSTIADIVKESEKPTATEIRDAQRK